jgi:hypothetical protein
VLLHLLQVIESQLEHIIKVTINHHISLQQPKNFCFSTGNQKTDQFHKNDADAENEDEYTSSVAEAYPAGEVGQDDEPLADEEAEVYSATRRTPKQELPKEIKNRKNKPKVQLVASDEEEDEDDDEESYAKARPASKGGKNTNTYFPIHFGETSGGAIAIANSFSKGKGGTAVSRATAYGSPSDSKTRKALTQREQ